MWPLIGAHSTLLSDFSSSTTSHPSSQNNPSSSQLIHLEPLLLLPLSQDLDPLSQIHRHPAHPSMTDLAGPTPAAQRPQPGDGAYLAQSQPGQGAFLQQSQNGRPRAETSGRGRGEARRGGPSRGRGRGGRQIGLSQTRDGEQAYHPGDRAHAAKQSNEHPDGFREPTNHHSGGLRRPAQPRTFDPVVPESSSTAAANGENGDQHGSRGVGGSGRGRNSRTRTPKRNGLNAPGIGSNGTVAAVTTAFEGLMTKGGSGSAQLDPGASTFVPSASSSAPLSRVTSRHSTGPPSVSGDTKSKKKKKSPKARNNVDQGGQNGTAAGTESATAAAGARSSRRAAFESQTKLTTTHNDDGEVSGQGRTTKGQNGDGNEKGKNAKGGRTIKEDKDDLVSRLTRGLKSRPYLECPIVSMEWVEHLITLANLSALTPLPLISPSGLVCRLRTRQFLRRIPDWTNHHQILPSITRLATPRSTCRVYGTGRIGRSWKSGSELAVMARTRMTCRGGVLDVRNAGRRALVATSASADE